jgi:hypothetical protein
MLTLKQHLVSGPRRVDAFQEAEFEANVRAQLTTLLLQCFVGQQSAILA